jgi:hypothetical protein
MNFAYIAYIFISIAIGLGGSMYLFRSERMIAAIIFLILSIFVFIFFGTRWFSSGNVIGTYTGSWPPIINTCPDYLVSYNKPGVSATDPKIPACIDLIGISRTLGTGTSGITMWNSATDNTTPPVTTSPKYFNYVYKAGMTQEQLQVLCDKANQLGLTWEGITNGDSCTFLQAPQVTGPNASGPAAASTSCPPTATTGH